MTFGKYKDEEISSLPSGYLKWMLENLPQQDYLEEARKTLLDRMLLQFQYQDEDDDFAKYANGDLDFYKD
jgi:hypothetical protein